MRYFISVILSIFCFVIPVYAVPDDFLLENSDNIDTTVYYDISDTNDLYSVSFDSIVRSPSINPDVPFNFIGFTISPYSSSSYFCSLNFEGTIPAPYDSFKRNASSGLIFNSSNNYQNNIAYVTNNGTPLTSFYLFDSVNNTLGSLVWSGNVVPTIDNNDFTIGIDVPTATLLSDVTQIFTWLLTSIGTLIVFILGNPFLAVMLCLFLAGTIISFFIRIRG